MGEFFGGLVLFALGLWFAKRPRLRADLATGALVAGTSGRAALGFFAYLPLALVLGGIYFMGRPILAAAGVDTDNIASHCGSDIHFPKGKKLAGSWKDYKCLSQAQAGTRWSLCLKRPDYSDTEGSGCHDDQLCCPADTGPAPAKSGK